MRHVLIPAVCSIVIFTCACATTHAQPATAPTAEERVGRMPHVEVDVKNRQVRVACEALRVDAPLEFFCVAKGTAEHEAVLRSAVKASDLHAALLMIGLEPGEPVRYSEAAKRWLPPHGPPLRIDVEFERADGEKVTVPAYKLMRSIRTKEPMPPLTWIFAGSRVMPDGNYAADVTGYLVSIVNFDLTVIDVPALVSNANETLEWETNLELMPEAGAPVTMILAPAGEVVEPEQADARGAEGPIDLPVVKVGKGVLQLDGVEVSLAELDEKLARLSEQRPAAATKLRIAKSPDAPPLMAQTVQRIARKHGIEATETLTVAEAPDPQLAQKLIENDPRETVALDQAKIDALRRRWDESIRSNRAALRDVARTQYQIIAELRREQQKLIDEADRIQRLIDQMQREYDEMTTPRPAGAGAATPE